jgi:hypothetical protein
MSFYVAGVEHVASNDWFVIDNNTVFYKMTSYANVTEGLELYCVGTITYAAGLHSDPRLMPIDARCGMAVSSTSAHRNTLAHEIGHACGLKDITYLVFQDSVGIDLACSANWSGGDGTGYHDPGLKHAALVQRLLMYDTANPQKADIAVGSVKGTGPNLPDSFPVGVGLDAMGARTPSH